MAVQCGAQNRSRHISGVFDHALAGRGDMSRRSGRRPLPRKRRASAVRIEDYAETLRGHPVLHLVGKGNKPATNADHRARPPRLGTCRGSAGLLHRWVTSDLRRRVSVLEGRASRRRRFPRSSADPAERTGEEGRRCRSFQPASRHRRGAGLHHSSPLICIPAGQRLLVEPPVGIEPTTFSLRVRRSTD
jgi:hypothetical protein